MTETKDQFAELTTRLGKSYTTWKAAEKKKNLERDKFFTEAIDTVGNAPLARITVDATGAPPAYDEVFGWIAKRYPRWRLVEVKTIDGSSQALIEEDPQYKDFVYINQKEGVVYERKIVNGSPVLDDEALRAEDPELWMRITEETRVLRPIEGLPAEELNAIQKYIRLGQPSAKLQPPRKAKPEELDETEG